MKLGKCSKCGAEMHDYQQKPETPFSKCQCVVCGTWHAIWAKVGNSAWGPAGGAIQRAGRGKE